jgi:CIC family chloride channel protein
MQPAFNIPQLTVSSSNPLPMIAFPILLFFGGVMGLVAALFVRSIYWAEDLFDRMPGNYYTRHMLGMLVVGLMMYLLLQQAGHYYVQGVGYATIEGVLAGALTSPGFLLLLVGLKLLATCLTLGSGASGGVFSPGLFMGACLGACLGGLVQSIDPSFSVPPSIFAVAGMAAMIGGTTGAVATATVMVFEMTRDLNAMLPIVLTVGVCVAVRNQVCPPTIYTLKLIRRGHVVPQGLAAAPIERQRTTRS